MSIRLCLGTLQATQRLKLGFAPLLSSSCNGVNITSKFTIGFTNRPSILCCSTHASTKLHSNLGQEIYNGPLAPKIRLVKRFSLASSFFGLLVQPVLIQKVIEEDLTLGFAVFTGVIVQFFTFVTPVLLHYVTKRYIRNIYYNAKEDTYTALSYNIWTGDKLLSFQAKDVDVPDIPGMFTSIVVKGYPLFMEDGVFQDYDHYKRIMGYDKPMDFKLHKKPEK